MFKNLSCHRTRLFLLATMALFSLSEHCLGEDAVPLEGKYATINGFEMYYEVHGEGDPLIMLHFFEGFICTGRKTANQ